MHLYFKGQYWDSDLKQRSQLAFWCRTQRLLQEKALKKERPFLDGVQGYWTMSHGPWGKMLQVSLHVIHQVVVSPALAV